MAGNSDLKNVGGMWVNKSKAGEQYMKIKINIRDRDGVKQFIVPEDGTIDLVCFKNNYRDNDRKPHFIVNLEIPKDGGASSEIPEIDVPCSDAAPGHDEFEDDDIPF